MIPKNPRWECKKLTDMARHYHCMNCGADDGTIVAAHSNSGRHGKGMAHKAHDVFVAFLCDRCHRWLDQGTGRDPTNTYDAAEKVEMWRHAHDATLLALFRDGKVKVAA
jgi:hypothetical protein